MARRLGAALRTLRWRLTLTFCALLALLLAALSTYQYRALQGDLVSTRTQNLAGDVSDASSVLAAQTRSTVVPPASSPGVGAGAASVDLGGLRDDLVRASLVSKALCQNIPAAPASVSLSPRTRAAAQTAIRRLRAEAFACAVARTSGRSVAVIVYGRTLTPVTSAGQPLEAIPRLDSGALNTALAGHASDPEVLGGSQGEQLVVAFPLPRGGTAVTLDGVAQLSTSTEAIDTVLRRERGQLAIGGAGVLGLALLAGLLLTGRALAPLRRLTETARALAGGDLRARSRLEPRRDEVGILAHSFDDMADNIEAAFAARAESEARMRRFIADASHELRTPVTALKGYVDVLRRGVSREPAALDAALEAMGREAERMRVLVLDLLTLARLDAHRPQEISPLELGEVVGGVLDEGVPGMPAELERRLDEAPVVVAADRGALITIARNLLVNACKYAPGARQTWAVWREAERGLLRVEDSGPGIAAADLPHVFERFYRGEKTRAREEGGSGLGLSIVQGLARSMGGDVAIESVEGRGAAVTVWLPLAAPMPEPRSASPSPRQEPPPAGQPELLSPT